MERIKEILIIPVAKLDTNEVNATPTNTLLILKLALREVIGMVGIKEGKEAIFWRVESERVTTMDPTVSCRSDFISQGVAGVSSVRVHGQGQGADR